MTSAAFSTFQPSQAQERQVRDKFLCAWVVWDTSQSARGQTTPWLLRVRRVVESVIRGEQPNEHVCGGGAASVGTVSKLLRAGTVAMNNLELQSNVQRQSGESRAGHAVFALCFILFILFIRFFLASAPPLCSLLSRSHTAH